MKNLKRLKKISNYTLKGVLLIILTAVIANAASGNVDPNFDAAAYMSINGAVTVIEKQPDGKYLIGGQFTVVNGIARTAIARFNSDGTLDTSFNPPDFAENDVLFGTGVQAIKVQPDGKILVGGNFNVFNGNVAPGLRRLNADGSVDNSFYVPLPFGSSISDIDIQSSIKIIISGSFSVPNTAYQGLARINPNGTIDNTFPTNVTGGFGANVEVQSDDKIIFSSGSAIVRLNADGTIDSTFNGPNINGQIKSFKLQSNGRIVIVGAFQSINGSQVGNIARLLTNGSWDTTFNLNMLGANFQILSVSIDTNDKIVIGGNFTKYNGVMRHQVAQLNSDGSLDSSFVPNLTAPTQVFAVNFLSGGRVLVGYKGTFTGALAQLNANGLVNDNMNFTVGYGGTIHDIVQQPDGKIVAAGFFDTANAKQRNSIVRFNIDGSIDETFNPPTSPSSPSIYYALALLADGKILVGGSNSIIRLNSDGSADPSFSASSFQFVQDLAVLPNGKILVVGGSGIRRLESNGNTDPVFNPQQPNSGINKMAVRSDGKIWIVGGFSQISVFVRNRIALLNDNGTVDNSFNPPGGANFSISDIDLQSDGKPIVVGNFTSLNGDNTKKYVGRYNLDGTLDNTFSSNVESVSEAVKIQPDGKILVGGLSYSSTFIPKPGIVRLNSNGSIDPTFIVGSGVNRVVEVITLQVDGKILLGGEFSKVNSKSTPLIARLLNDSNVINIRTPFDFDGDGKSDVSVFRPSGNVWYAIRSGNGSVLQENFGVNGDILAPADFDGDGKTDLGIFRSSTASWWYLSSVDNTQKSVQFGANGDIPLPSDINGDGADDFVVFRPSNNTWYRATSDNGTVSSIAFGANGDKPLIGDFDGDGKADPAIFRPSTGDWWYRSSIDNSQRATNWGLSTDIPVPSDYDGDGKTDLAVYRPSEGGWYIFNSGSGQPTTLAFGVSTDIPVPADYDGDGKADIAVFRPSTGIWYLLQSSNGFAGLQFGISTDKPIPSVFQR